MTGTLTVSPSTLAALHLVALDHGAHLAHGSGRRAHLRESLRQSLTVSVAAMLADDEGDYIDTAAMLAALLDDAMTDAYVGALDLVDPDAAPRYAMGIDEAHGLDPVPGPDGSCACRSCAALRAVCPVLVP